MNGWVRGKNWALFSLGGMRYDGCGGGNEQQLLDEDDLDRFNHYVECPVCPFGYAPETSKGTGKVEDDDKEEEGDEDDCSAGFLPKLIEVDYATVKIAFVMN
ncbi:hypothetical protein K435DRAFT_799849 [Dendrothele bispora CBS 962.96]|uniref:Uncharacterized protein n=1 Tax=Dendrothele bispora (strain CBS 962.96) TaxID=1314807 RepID=A0A4S8LW27_DENBC|nr:hypothetical protein K435DRAFT_799849 [Dendrothele bispora CBS 962.96]